MELSIRPANCMDIGSQWIHDETKEPYTIISVEYTNDPLGSLFIACLISHDSIRKYENDFDLFRKYTYVRPMRGAYK